MKKHILKKDLNSFSIWILFSMWLISMWVYLEIGLSKILFWRSGSDLYYDWIYSMWWSFGICNFDAFHYMKYIFFFLFMQGFISAPLVLILHAKRTYYDY